MLEKVRKKIRIHITNLKRGISLDTSINIHKSVVISTAFGGEILVKEQTELQVGVCLMTYGGIIEIGKRCSINPYTVIYGHGRGTIIQDDVLIAGHCLIIPANHNFSDLHTTINSQGINSKGIIIESNVWIGAGCKILDGVTIGYGSIVAAGSVVTKSIEPLSIVAGIPAKIIRKRI